MRVEVRLFATLREKRFDTEVREYPPGFTVGQVLDDLDIPESEAKIVFVNSRHAKFEQVLNDGDILGVFPPIGGG